MTTPREKKNKRGIHDSCMIHDVMSLLLLRLKFKARLNYYSSEQNIFCFFSHLLFSTSNKERGGR